MRKLTKKQDDILDFIQRFSIREGMAPTVYEIAEHFHIKAPTAFMHLRALSKKGYIERSSKARSLTLKKHPSAKHLSLSLSVPILGRISAGEPLYTQQNIEETIKLDPSMIPPKIAGCQLFGLHVNGDSMKDAGILHNDLVIVKDSTEPRTGDIVVALVHNTETTIKYFYINRGKVELRPANDAFESQFYNYDEVSIQGILISMFRHYY